MDFDYKTTFPAVDVVAAALAAYKDTNGGIVRSTYVTREKGQEKTVLSSRDVALQYLAAPERLEAFKQEAEDAILYFQQQTMMSTLLAKKNSSFANAISEAITRDNIVLGNVGLIVWLPKMLAQMRNHEESRITWITHATNSIWIPAKENEKVTVDFTLIEKRYVQDKNFWVAAGYTPEGYIINFLSGNEKKIINKGRITGKVKSFTVDKYRNDAKITNLNYVKIVE